MLKSKLIFFIFSISFASLSIPSTVDNNSFESDFWLIYESGHLNSNLFIDHSKESLLILIYNYQDQKYSETNSDDKIIIPFGPTLDVSKLTTKIETENKFLQTYEVNALEFSQAVELKLHQSLESLTESELKNFLSKKNDYLEKISIRLVNGFKLFKLPVPYKKINSFLKKINNSIYLEADKFVKANTTGIPLYISAGFGMGWGRVLFDLIFKNTKFSKEISRDSGFYFLLSTGFGFSTTKIEGRTIRTIDLFFDVEKFKHALTPFAEGFASIGTGAYFEQRVIKESITNSQRFWFLKNRQKTKLEIQSEEDVYTSDKYLGPLKIKTGNTGFSINISIMGASFPLFSLIRENSMTRYYFHLPIYDSHKKNPSSRKHLSPQSISSLKACYGFYK